ncbi:MAG: hypothetical protein ACRD4D_01790 [Candidatus Acidiferrales bacterium]
MKRALILLSVGLLVLVTIAAAPSTPAKRSPTDTARSEGGRGGQLEQGGAEIGRHYGEGGQELGKGSAGFGKGVAQGKFSEAGKSIGSGSAGFGKNVGTGTARGFKRFGLAFRNVGKRIDRWASNDQ